MIVNFSIQFTLRLYLSLETATFCYLFLELEEEETNNHTHMPSTNGRTMPNHHAALSRPKQTRGPIADDNVRTQLYEMITKDLDKFVLTTIPKGLHYIQCHITRTKGDIYNLLAERPTDHRKVSDDETKQFEVDRFS